MTVVDKVKRFISGRRIDYNQVFPRDNPIAVRVLADLAKFCRANESCFHMDPRAHAVAEGRREVWLRIQHQLQLSEEDLWKFYGRKDLE